MMTTHIHMTLVALLSLQVVSSLQQRFQRSNHNHHHHHHPHHIPSVASLCASLPASHNARQMKLCKLVHRSPAADETIALGAARGLAECRAQFKSERWDCTHSSGLDAHLLTGKLAQSVGTRESAYVQAILAAGIVHSVATACSQGTLSDCACDKTRVGLIRQEDQIWKWGGCSNNIRHGMMFARHLVELLDAVHQQQHQQHLNHTTALHSLKKRALNSSSSRQRTIGSDGSVAASPNQVLTTNRQTDDHSTQISMAVCSKKPANISQSTHIQLIKSILAKNSLERHQDFRLAVNAHNNRVGRMAVARNMEIKCRCHGLSGSCSLKTCWLRLPDFQQIGSYLRRKYDLSVHLPTAINVNKLLHLMDRKEMSTILMMQHQLPVVAEDNSVAAAAAAAATHESPEFAALTSSGGEKVDGRGATATPTQNSSATPHFNYYERHKQLERLSRIVPPPQVSSSTTSGSCNNQSTAATCIYLHGDEVPIQVAPMSQAEYAQLLRDMKLCNSQPIVAQSAAAAGAIKSMTTTSHLSTRDAGSSSSTKLAQSQQNKKQSTQQQLIEQHQHQISALLSASTSASAAHATRHHDHQLDLVHLHRSPAYCEHDERHEFAGVQSRTCSADSLAPNSCDKLCCGRGYETRESQLRFQCDCKFQYCCKIHCNVCHKRVVEYVCR